MLNIKIEKPPKMAKFKLVQIRMPEDLFKKLKALVPKNEYVSMQKLVVTILETTLDSGQVKIKVVEHENEKRSGPNND